MAVTKKLSEYVAGRDNNYNLIRFIAAALVLYSHSYPLTKNAEPLNALLGVTWGSMAVSIFFISSGFLVMASLWNKNNVLAFAWARILRIYPALIVAVLFCVAVVGWYFTTYDTADYFSDPVTLKYIKRNITLFNSIKYELPGVFADNPYPSAVNGSLWTLPYEIKMYTYLAVICTLLLYIQKKLQLSFFNGALLTMTLVSLVANIASQFSLIEHDYKLHFFSIFFAGASFYIFRDKILMSPSIFWGLLLVLALSVYSQPVFQVLYLLILPYLIFYLAYVPAGKVRAFNRFGDYSYGLYIYAFPVQQSVVALMPDVSVWVMTLVAFVVSLVLSYFSWHLVEKKALALKDTYVVVERFFSRLKRAKSLAG